MSVGAEIRSLREERGWSAKELAERAGIAPEVLSRIENGRVNPRRDTLERLAEALGTSVESFGQPSRAEEVLVMLYRSLPLDKQRWVVQQLAAMAAGMEVAEDFHPLIGDEVAVR